ncbi:MAG: hypothetical protein QG656_822 [Candidatus Hydrogenedentes bacterium]|nr:hypothetical protein [Candidatus Hydrogenedentota bacterium]
MIFPKVYAEQLEALYARYNRREFVCPDPLQFLYGYADVRDREIAGFVASALAYGRVAQILRSVAAVLEIMGPRPRAYLESAADDALARTFGGFRHRFTSGDELAAMLAGIRSVLDRHGSLNACFVSYLDPAAPDTLDAAAGLVREIHTGDALSSLLACPTRGSACKRLHLYLRWMVRRDDVDPGGWTGVSPAQLVVPLDTHMFAIGRALGFTQRRQADGKTAVEMSAAFRQIVPQDPVRYDFALTRLGIRSDTDMAAFLASCR